MSPAAGPQPDATEDNPDPTTWVDQRAIKPARSFWPPTGPGNGVELAFARVRRQAQTLGFPAAPALAASATGKPCDCWPCWLEPPPQADSVPETACGLPQLGLTAMTNGPHRNEQESYEPLSKQDHSRFQERLSANFTSPELPRFNRQNLPQQLPEKLFLLPMTDQPINELANQSNGGTSRTLYLYKREHATPKVRYQNVAIQYCHENVILQWSKMATHVWPFESFVPNVRA